MDEALELREALEEELGTDKFVVTLDPRKADAVLDRRGWVAVVINPPIVTALTTTQGAFAWEIVVTTGPADNPVAAWTTLAAVVEGLLLSDLGFRDATPGLFPANPGKEYPAYTLTLTT
ncbi:hypothetical protein [Arthrobacter woluwensis]|uniref:hypothetical protein n=1 Tax=Arthrobacter woluwensis TaxID=156980 RepID=UPI001AAE82A5|nr:hypothetical protein [Arthrobacter woluwensis]QTF71762.1 hypothetical protein G8758_06915 [Arthrobacter woluwensis]